MRGGAGDVSDANRVIRHQAAAQYNRSGALLICRVDPTDHPSGRIRAQDRTIQALICRADRLASIRFMVRPPYRLHRGPAARS